MPHVVDGSLGRLIETEARLAEVVAAAEREAEALLRSAREAAEDGEAGSRSRLESDLAALTARVAADRDEAIARVGTEADARCRRFHELPADLVDRLAAWVEGRLLAPGSEGEPA